MSEIEELKLALSDLRNKTEALQGHAELNYKKLDMLGAQQEEQPSKVSILGSILPGFATIVVAIVGLWGAYLAGQSTLSVERLKFESGLITDALKAESQADAAKKLDFLVRAHLIDRRDGAIEALVKQPEFLPIKTQEMRLREIEEAAVSRCVAEGGVLDAGTLKCTPRPTN